VNKDYQFLTDTNNRNIATGWCIVSPPNMVCDLPV